MKFVKMKKIKIFDTTLRDGEQSPGASLNKEEKLIIAKQLAKLNVDVIEAGFPIASNDDFEAVKMISKEVKGPVICVLARAKKEDIDKARESLKYAEKSRIHIFLATSKVHIHSKLHLSEKEVLCKVYDMVCYARNFFDEVEFTPEDSARTDIDFMIKVIETAIKAGARIINIADTVGYAEPEEFGKRVKYVFDKLGGLIEEKNVIISVHCHDDLGLAVANSLEGIRNGATQVECTVNGIGERAGNCSLEEIVMNLKTRKDYFGVDVDINTKEIFRTSRIVSKLTGIEIQKNKAIVGSNAFAHEAGIHQHGVINNKLTYEIMDPKDVGWEGTRFVLGKHSGRHMVEKILKEKGYNFNANQIKELSLKLKKIADIKKRISEKDVEKMIQNNLKKNI